QGTPETLPRPEPGIRRAGYRARPVGRHGAEAEGSGRPVHDEDRSGRRYPEADAVRQRDGRARIVGGPETVPGLDRRASEAARRADDPPRVHRPAHRAWRAATTRPERLRDRMASAVPGEREGEGRGEPEPRGGGEGAHARGRRPAGPRGDRREPRRLATAHRHAGAARPGGTGPRDGGDRGAGRAARGGRRAGTGRVRGAGRVMATATRARPRAFRIANRVARRYELAIALALLLVWDAWREQVDEAALERAIQGQQGIGSVETAAGIAVLALLLMRSPTIERDLLLTTRDTGSAATDALRALGFDGTAIGLGPPGFVRSAPNIGIAVARQLG